jgi:hypothetical protein
MINIIKRHFFRLIKSIRMAFLFYTKKVETAVVYEDDTIKVFKCGCRISKLEPPADKDYFCKIHTRKF